MADRVLLGIDLGTTVLKAAAFAAGSGKLLAVARAELPVRTGPDGMREQDLKHVDAALSRVTGTLRRRLGAAWRRVAGVGLAAQGGSAIIVDAGTGKPQTPMQLWNDTRPTALLAGIARRKPPGYWQRLSFLDGPGAGLARIQWLRKRFPRLFHKGNLYVGAGEYAYFRLTGVWRQDAGNALQIGCYDARRRRLATAPLKLVGVGMDFVAPMREGHETHGLSAAAAKQLKLSAGTPVVGPYIDQEAGYLCASETGRRPLQLSLGTAWVGNFVLPRGEPPAGFNLVLPSPVGRGSLVIRVMLAGNVSWDWARATLLDGPVGSLQRSTGVFQKALLPPPGLVALPWLTQPNALDPKQAGSGGFIGMGPHTTREDLLRAMAAGMCYELRRVFGPVIRRRTVDSVVLTGGAAAGKHFRTLLAALFAPLPVRCVSADEQAAARGAIRAFSRRAARAATTACRRGSQALTADILAGYRHYRAMCAAMPDDAKGLLLCDHCKGKRS